MPFGVNSITPSIPELIFQTRDDYIHQVIALAQDPAKLKSIRDRLRAGRDTSALFDTPLLVRSLEALSRIAGDVPQPDLRNLDLYHEISADIDVETAGSLDTPAYLEHYRNHIEAVNSAYPFPPGERISASGVQNRDNTGQGRTGVPAFRPMSLEY